MVGPSDYVYNPGVVYTTTTRSREEIEHEAAFAQAQNPVFESARENFWRVVEDDNVFRSFFYEPIPENDAVYEAVSFYSGFSAVVRQQFDEMFDEDVDFFNKACFKLDKYNEEILTR